MLRNHGSPAPSHPGRLLNEATPIASLEVAAMVGQLMDAVVNDEMVVAWFSRNRATIDGLSEEALAEIAPWLPIIGMAANDRSIGVIDYHRPTD